MSKVHRHTGVCLFDKTSTKTVVGAISRASAPGVFKKLPDEKVFGPVRDMSVERREMSAERREMSEFLNI
jgi:hypothetical protein